MGASDGLEPLPTGFVAAVVGFELLEFEVASRVVAIRERGRPPVLGPNPFPPEHPNAPEAERALALLDWGTRDAPAIRLDHAAFRAARDAHLPFVATFIFRPARPVDPHGNATGDAWCLFAQPGGFAVYRAESPHDRLPGAEDLGPLGRAGYWGGSPAALVWLGYAADDLAAAMDAVHTFDLALWGFALLPGGVRRPSPGGEVPAPPGDLFEHLVTLYQEGWWHPPGDELRVAIGGRWASTAGGECALCGALTDLERFGAGRVHLCGDCRPHFADATLASAKRVLRRIADLDPLTLAPGERAAIDGFMDTMRDFFARHDVQHSAEAPPTADG